MNRTVALDPGAREPVATPVLDLRAQDGLSRLRGAAMLPLAFTGLIALAVILTLRGVDTRQIVAMVPRSPLFWLVFAAYYLCGPVSEWFIFRKLWALPAGSFGALLRKLVCNELLLGYLGEAYFYTWARRHTAMTSAPFAAIKDVAILSAMVGNGVTLVLLAITWPLVRATPLGMGNGSVVLSLGAVLVTSIAIMAFRRRLFSLDRPELAFICAMHLARIVAATVLSALLWHLVLPDVPVVWWLFLATLRLLISRLPFVPNKDVVFAGLAVLTLGHETSIAMLMTMLASAILLVHLAVGGILVVMDLLRGEALR